MITNANREVNIKYNNLQNTTNNDKVMSDTMDTIYINKLNSGSSPGIVSSGGLAAKHPALGDNGHRFEPSNSAHYIVGG